MDVGELILRCRLESRLTLRALASRAGTSHSTLSAYESGRKVPSLPTLQRILDAAGYTLDVDVRRKPMQFDPDERAREIAELLELGALFPATHAPTLQAPIFRRHR